MSGRDQGAFATRAACAAVRVIGGCRITLRLPALPSATDASQLGLEEAGYNEVALAPVLIKAVSASESVLLVSANVLHAALGLTKIADVRSAFAGSAGVAMQRGWWLLTEVQAMEAFGGPYLYQLRVRQAQGQA